MLAQLAGVDAIGLGETGLPYIHTRTHNRQTQLTKPARGELSTSARTGRAWGCDLELPDALPEMPVLKGPYLLERRTASTGLDPDSTKLAVKIDFVGAMVLHPSSPCANQRI